MSKNKVDSDDFIWTCKHSLDILLDWERKKINIIIFFELLIEFETKMRFLSDETDLYFLASGDTDFKKKIDEKKHVM